MLCLFRPSFEVVEEGRILNKTKHLQRQNVSVFCLVPGLRQVLKKIWCSLPKKSGKSISLTQGHHLLYIDVRGSIK